MVRFAMSQFTVFYYIFGAVSLVLGLLGYVRAKSKASLISGGIAGVLLLAGAWWMSRGERSGLWVCAAVSVLLTARFLPGFLVKKNLYPAGIMALLGIIGVVIAAMLLFR